MQIYLCKQNGTTELREVDNSLEALQEVVGGYIETLTIRNGLVMVCNEEGKLNGSKPNRFVKGDLIYGDFFFCGTDGEDFCDVPADVVPVLDACYRI